MGLVQDEAARPVGEKPDETVLVILAAIRMPPRAFSKFQNKSIPSR